MVIELQLSMVTIKDKDKGLIYQGSQDNYHQFSLSENDTIIFNNKIYKITHVKKELSEDNVTNKLKIDKIIYFLELIGVKKDEIK